MLGDASGQLSRAVSQLPDASAYLEKQFLGFQKTLERLATASQDLILHGRNVVNMASGREMGDISFDAVFALLDSPLNYLGETQVVLEELAIGLRGSLDAISRLLQIERALEATVAPLQITQVMFRIQAAYLPSEHRQVFNSVTDEIVTLQAQIQSAFSEHVTVLSGLYGNLVQVVGALEQQIATQGRKIKEKREELSRYLASVTAEIKSNADRDVALTGASEELGQKVSSAVFTLQIQDIIAQKLAHASSGIEDTMAALSECEASSDTRCFANVAKITKVEVAQLDGVVGELQKADQSLHLVFGGIAELLERLNGDTLLLKEFGEMTASANGSIQGLLESLEEIRGMVAATLATTKMAEESVLPVRTATEGLTSTVQGVAHEMHLIALNAQIQAIQMGEGTGLDVLAAHSTEVSQATTKISMEVASKVSEVAVAVAAHSDRLIALRQAGQRQQAELDQTGQRQEIALHRFRDQTLQEFGATGEALDRARRLGAEITALLDVQPAVDKITAVRERVAELQRQSEMLERAFVVESSLPGQIDEKFEKKYTMASERLIHSKILGQRSACESIQPIEVWEANAHSVESPNLSPERSGPRHAGQSDASGFGDGVELF